MTARRRVKGRVAHRCIYCGELINIVDKEISSQFIVEERINRAWIHAECEPETRDEFCKYVNPRPSRKMT
jgi:hypothetical protein